MASMIAETLLVIALTWLATTRVTRLITTDQITHPIRARVTRKLGPDHWLPYLLHCPHCASVWVALPATALTWHLHDMATSLHLTSWLGLPLLWLATAYATARTLTTEKGD